MKPLEGIRILDFTQFMAGPMATLMLADYGAEVIKIENPPLGDNTRYGKIIENDASSHYASRNRGKKSILLNMKDEKHKELFLKLVKTADAVIENFKPGTMEKFGITYELLESINPKIVYTSVSGFGQTGPYAKHAAFDSTIQAEAGIMSITGEEGGNPIKCGGSVADYSGALVGCIGTLMGIIDAQRNGHGRRIDVSMMDALVFMLENQMSAFLRHGNVPTPNGNRYPGASPIGDFMCKDGKPIMLHISTDIQWKKFSEALNHPEWLENPHFVSMSMRGQHYLEVEAEVRKVVAQYDSQELMDLLQSKQCVYGMINNFEDVKNHPQIAHRKTFVDAVYPNGVKFTVPGNPISMSGMERQTTYETATLGEHTFEVLSEVADEAELHEIFDPVMAKAREAEKELFAKS